MNPQPELGAKGYDCDLVCDVKEYFNTRCVVCNLLLRNCQQTTCCGALACKTCILQVVTESRPCPGPDCDETTVQYFNDLQHQKVLNKFDVYCSNRKNGCEWKGKLEQHDDHLNLNPTPEDTLEGCEFAIIPCVHDMCSESKERREMDQHQRNCKKRPFECTYCNGYKSSYEDVELNHWPKCDFYVMRCQCGESVQRRRMENHKSSTCELEEVYCDFRYAQCKAKMPRKDMLVHLNEGTNEHLKLMSHHFQQIIKQQATKIQELETKLQQMKVAGDCLEKELIASKCIRVHKPNRILPITLTMNNVSQSLSNKGAWFSKSFFTEEGYALYLCVYTGGNGIAARAFGYISVSLHVAKGDHDDELAWPKKMNLEVVLLGQPNEEQNWSKRITLYANRNSDKECGCWDFINFNDLSLSSRFIKNNCLKFKVQVPE